MQFNNIPANLRVPLFFAELDPRFANTAAPAQRTLLIGQIAGSATLVGNTPTRIVSASDGMAAAGVGSILAGMIDFYHRNDPIAELWVLPLADNGAGAAATGSVTFTGPATAAGTLPLYVAGQNLAVGISAGDTASTIAAAVAAAIAAAGLPVTATVTTGTVNLTARNKGLAGNDIDIRMAYLGTAGGEVVPAGVGATITGMSGGATNPVLTSGLTALGDQGFDFIVSSLTDSTSLDAIKAFLADSTGRWSSLQQIYGHAFAAYKGTAGAAASFCAGRNDQHLTVIPYNDSPSPSWEWAAALAGQAAASLRLDPAQPLQYLAVAGVLAPPIASRYTLSVRNSTLLYSGATTWFVDGNGAVTIENMVTTYVTNNQGAPDNSYLEIETMFTLVYVLRFLRNRVQLKFSRVKLAADGVRLLPNSNVVTPAVIRADLIAAYRELEEAGFVQKSGAFAAGLIVEKDATNPNRVNVLWPGTLINQLRQFATLIQFRLI